KAAIDITLTYYLSVNGTIVYGPRYYGHTKNGNAKPLFHGSWGYHKDHPHQWGRYQRSCYLILKCTSYMNAKSGVAVNGTGTFLLGSTPWNWGINQSWGKNTGKVEPWRGVLRWAGLPH